MLKDAARVWNNLLFDNFQSYGLKECKAMRCVLVKPEPVVICYVQDLITYSDMKNAIMDFRSNISKDFKVENVGIP